MDIKFNYYSKKSEQEIYFEFADAMMLLCLRYIGNKEDAEEVMNNAFLKAFKNKSNFEEIHSNSYKAWLKKIMINECLMHLRKEKEFKIVSLDDDNFKLKLPQVSDNTDIEYLLKLLNELPLGYRTVFNLYAIEGYKHSEIAELLKISENTSRSQLLKARKELQEKITKQNLQYGT
jgi:RNA polymerase sigma-70 factor (ECF subfamily)